MRQPKDMVVSQRTPTHHSRGMDMLLHYFSGAVFLFMTLVFLVIISL